MNLRNRFNLGLLGVLCLLFVFNPRTLRAQEPLTGFDLQVKEWAFQCRDEMVAEMNKLLDSHRLTMDQLFDTFYIPIPGTNPQKFHTQYDRITDQTIRSIEDRYLEKDSRLLFVVAVDRNGYLPTHNTRYSRPLTKDQEFNLQYNRTKRIFDDRTGLAAARNTKPYLLQSYSRDTGETLYDLSVPIFIRGKHWGALRIGFKK